MALVVPKERERRKSPQHSQQREEPSQAQRHSTRGSASLRSRSKDRHNAEYPVFEGVHGLASEGSETDEDLLNHSGHGPSAVRWPGCVVQKRVHNVLLCAIVSLCVVAMSHFLSIGLEPSNLGIAQRAFEEHTLQRDPRTKRYGFTYTEQLVLSKVDPSSPAWDTGLGAYVGRRISRINGVPVRSKADLQNTVHARDARTSLSQHLVLSFAPILRVGGAVRAVKRLATTDGVTIQQGSLGVILRVPGYSTGSAAQVRIDGARFDAMDTQIESVVEEDLLPHRLEKPPMWIKKKTGVDDIKDIIEALDYARYDYLPRLVAHGLDRPDHIAAARPSEVEGLGIVPLHFKKIYQLSKAVVQERRRVERLATAELIASRDLLRLAELEEGMKRRALQEEIRTATLAPLNVSLPLNGTDAALGNLTLLPGLNTTMTNTSLPAAA